MKKFIAVLLCVVLLSVTASFSAIATEESDVTKETTEQVTAQETELVLELDVNKRYTDIVENTDGLITDLETQKKALSDNQKTVYIAVLCAALAVSVVVLVVSLKKVPKEEDIDISGRNKIKKNIKE